MNEPAEYVTIVSGLPRSGTSMMMRMLEAGGMPVLVDGVREPDENNPRGYYEFEPVKQTKRDPSWVDSAAGKAVKMVYRLLCDLPADRTYRVIFMRRNLEEVLASQRKMLRREGRDDEVSDEDMAALFRGELEQFNNWVRIQPNFAMLEIDYNEMLADAGPSARRASAFLDGRVDPAAMCAVVDPALYRNRG